jgi:rare lipoprotein A
MGSDIGFLAAVRLSIAPRNSWEVLEFIHFLPSRNLCMCRNTANEFALSICFPFVVRPIMHLIFGIVAIATVPAWMGIHMGSAAAQTFNERWSIIPKAHAEPAPEALDQTKQDPQTQPPFGGEPTRGSEDRSATRPFNRAFFGKASYYSYQTGKTASGSSFDRNLLTAAHRGLPFGTRVRVTELESNRSVVVRITDRGPWVRGRVLDLSLGAARSLGITDRGVAQVRAEVL